MGFRQARKISIRALLSGILFPIKFHIFLCVTPFPNNVLTSDSNVSIFFGSFCRSDVPAPFLVVLLFLDTF